MRNIILLFFKKDKQKPFNILKKNDKYQEAFVRLGDPQLFTYRWSIGTTNVVIDVDFARLQLFINTRFPTLMKSLIAKMLKKLMRATYPLQK